MVVWRYWGDSSLAAIGRADGKKRLGQEQESLNHHVRAGEEHQQLLAREQADLLDQPFRILLRRVGYPSPHREAAHQAPAQWLGQPVYERCEVMRFYRECL